jgi:AbrB family looped-hinge helix DNA binding protein
MKRPKGKYAWTVTVGEKGQIVIPKQARTVFGIHPGDTLVILGDEQKGLAIPPKGLFAQFAAAVFETQEDSEEDEEDE